MSFFNLVKRLFDAIENGGLISFYFNHGADYLDDTLEDLKKIDAIDVINMLEEVIKLFPNGKPPKEIDKRNEVIDSWCDGQYEDLLESLDERFYNELQENLELNIDEIVRRLL